MLPRPKWTVLYNIVSAENTRFIGTGWEFFIEEKDAKACYERHDAAGNCPAKRPYNDHCDYPHLGAAHKMGDTYGPRSIMTLVASRREFEAHLRLLDKAALFFKRDPEDGKYTNRSTQTAWTGWKMRDGLLPTQFPDQDKEDAFSAKGDEPWQP